METGSLCEKTQAGGERPAPSQEANPGLPGPEFWPRPSSALGSRTAQVAGHRTHARLPRLRCWVGSDGGGARWPGHGHMLWDVQQGRGCGVRQPRPSDGDSHDCLRPPRAGRCAVAAGVTWRPRGLLLAGWPAGCSQGGQGNRAARPPGRGSHLYGQCVPTSGGGRDAEIGPHRTRKGNDPHPGRPVTSPGAGAPRQL